MEDFGTAEKERLLARFGRPFQKGDVIFREGEDANEAYLLQEGTVRLVKRVRGAERSLMVLKANDLFGESALIEAATRTSTAVALTDGVSLAIDPATLRRLLEANPSIVFRLVQQLIRRLAEAEDQIELMMLRGDRTKIVAALLKMARAPFQQQSEECVLAITPMELAGRVGTDVDKVKSVVNQLRDEQYLQVVDEQLEIVDVSALAKLYSLLTLRDEIQGTSTPPPGGSRS